MDVQIIKSKLRVIPDFPKPGIMFQDIFPLFKEPHLVELLVSHFVTHIQSSARKVDVIVGLDARGFLIGPMISTKLGCSFAPVRKSGKLPGKTVSVSYEKEYGLDTFEMQSDAIEAGQTVVVIDDLLATGGSAKAAGQLVKQLQGVVLEYLFIIELTALQGSTCLESNVYSMIKID